MLLFELHKDNLDLAQTEVLALCNTKKGVLIDNLFLVRSRYDPILLRLAYTRQIFEVLGAAKSLDCLESFLKHVKIGSCTGSFCVRVYPANKPLELLVAKQIFHKCKNPRVDLDDPHNFFALFCYKNKAILAKRVALITNNFESRKAHYRACLKPVSLHPKLAAAMVNLSGVRSGCVLDPCAGTGGILLEAGLMNLEITGVDVDPEMVNACTKNLAKFGVAARVLHQDALLLQGSFPVVVSDLPYGRNTKDQDVSAFFYAMLKMLRRWKTKIAVFGLPSFVNVNLIAKKAGVIVSNEFVIYIHKSLSKKIVVIKKGERHF